MLTETGCWYRVENTRRDMKDDDSRKTHHLTITILNGFPYNIIRDMDCTDMIRPVPVTWRR